MASIRMFEKSLQTNYRYRLILGVDLSESKNLFNLQLKVGHGIPMDDMEEFYFTSCRNLNLEGELQSLAYVFGSIKEIILGKFQGDRFLVERLNLKLTSENGSPLIFEKKDISTTEALQDLAIIESKALAISERFAPPAKRGCFIL